MNRLSLTLDRNSGSFAPGEQIAGEVAWELEPGQDQIEVRLYWHTEGKGDKDLTIVASVAFAAPRQRDSERFTLQAPLAPVSFSGRLMTLAWQVEAVALPSRDAAHVPVVIAPGGVEVRI